MTFASLIAKSIGLCILTYRTPARGHLADAAKLGFGPSALRNYFTLIVMVTFLVPAA